MDDPILLQVMIDADVHRRVSEQRQKLGMSLREFMRRLLLEALPRWEAAAPPSPQDTSITE